MRIIGVDLLNEGQGISIDDITIESQMTFIARSIIPWTPAGRFSDKANVTVSRELDSDLIDEKLPLG